MCVCIALICLCPPLSSNVSPVGIMLFSLFLRFFISWGTGIRELMRGMATLPQGNQELLVVKDKVGRPPGELGVSKSIECDIFPFSALTLLVGRQEGIRPVKNTGCWW